MPEGFSFLENLWDQTGRLRYGMPTSEKERLAAEGSLPGAPPKPDYAHATTPINGMDYDEQSNRYAAGYLATKAHPVAGPTLQPYINAIKTSVIPWLGRDSPELQAQAQQGMNRAMMDNARMVPAAAAQSAALRTIPVPMPGPPPPRNPYL